ncbi:MAG: LamG-like jellyroll fold domain-containing protein [Bacteroidota bacterium]|nr:LamG-like jellyroll fold domain-containing protein [Bacteroidota bacterium]
MRKSLFILVVMLFSMQSMFAQDDYVIEYDGIDQRVYYETDASLDQLNGATDYTIEAWVKPLSTDIHNNVVIKRWYQFAITLYQDDSKRVYFTHYTNGGTTTYINTIDNVINIDEWNHIAVINNSTENSIKLYVNGVDASLESYTALTLEPSPDDFDPDFHPNMYIANGGAGTNLNAQIDDVRILNEAEDIANLQTTSPGGTEYTTDANTIVLMKFNEGTGDVTADEANGGAIIEVQNTPSWVLLGSSSVNEVSNLNVNIYPNPANEFVNINLSELNNISEIAVYDITGRKVFTSATLNQSVISINTSDFASGLYNVVLIGDKNTFTTKLSIVK